MKKNVLAITIFLAALAFFNKASAQSMSDVMDQLGKAVETSKTDKGAAVKQLEEVIALCDKVGDDAKEARAKCTGIIAKWQNSASIDLITSKKYPEAIASCQKAVSLATTYSDGDALTSAKTLLTKTHYSQGVDLFSSKNYDGALTALTKAGEEAKANNLQDIVGKSNSLISKVYLIKGSGFYSAKKYDEAITSFTKATAADPDNAKAFYYQGLAFKGKGETDNMVASMEKAITIGAASDTAIASSARRNLAGTFLVKASEAYTAKNYSDAVTAAKSASKYDTKSSKAYLILAISANALKQSDDAIEAAKAGIAHEKSPAALSDLYFQLGKGYELNKDVANACASYKKVTAGPNVQAAQGIIKNVLKCK